MNVTKPSVEIIDMKDYDEMIRKIEKIGRVCYKSEGNITEESAERFIRNILKRGHESVIEHEAVTVRMICDRGITHEIVRHRIASYSVQSQRYVRLDGFEYVTPPEVAADPEASAAFEQAMRAENEQYERIAALLKEGHTRRLMREEGLTEAAAAKKAEKLAIEDARFVLPNACETKMIVTMNARSLHNFFRHRCCSRAQWEIRALADEMLRLVYPVAPALFAAAGPSCVKGACPEGAMSCGDSAGMRAKYASLKKGALN